MSSATSESGLSGKTRRSIEKDADGELQWKRLSLQIKWPDSKVITDNPNKLYLAKENALMRAYQNADIQL